MTINGTKYLIDLQAMIQLNTETNKERSIRRNPPFAPLLKKSPPPVIQPSPIPQKIPASTSTPPVWEWKDDNGFAQYGASISNSIEADYQANNICSNITSNGKSYVIKFKAMKQINLNTGYCRCRNSFFL